MGPKRWPGICTPPRMTVDEIEALQPGDLVVVNADCSLYSGISELLVQREDKLIFEKRDIISLHHSLGSWLYFLTGQGLRCYSHETSENVECHLALLK